jgi:hypothetical protein
METARPETAPFYPFATGYPMSTSRHSWFFDQARMLATRCKADHLLLATAAI